MLPHRPVPRTGELFRCSRLRSPGNSCCSWNDPPLDPSWTTPDPMLTGKIESAQGMLIERFAFCQSMTLDEFVKTRRGSPQIGIPPHPFPPLRRGQNSPGGGGLEPRWATLENGSRSDRRRDPPDRRAEQQGGISSSRGRRISGSGWAEGKPISRFAALWTQRTGPDDVARMVIASSAAELTKARGHNSRKLGWSP